MLEMWDVGDVECLGCGILGMWDVGDVGRSGCSRCGMLVMWNVGCGMFTGLRDVDLQNA